MVVSCLSLHCSCGLIIVGIAILLQSSVLVAEEGFLDEALQFECCGGYLYGAEFYFFIYFKLFNLVRYLILEEGILSLVLREVYH